MARMELRKPIDTLLNEKNKFDKQMTELQDKYNACGERLQTYRAEQAANREAKERLSNTQSNKIARKVLDQGIADAQVEINKIQIEIEELEKNRVVVGSRLKAIEGSIAELRRQ